MQQFFDPITKLIEQGLFSKVFEYAYLLFPIWLPVFLWGIFWHVWVNYVRAEFFYKQKYLLLEIKLPKETMKSPKAMELFMVTLHQTGGEGTWYDKYWLGKTRPWFSLELVSVEGQVKFFIWMRANWRPIVEAGLYAQFPTIEIYEAPDYTKSVSFDPKTMNIWACDFELTKMNEPYPLKTYIDYGLDKDPKEEFKVDPLTNLIEFLGTIGQNQQIWYQIILRAHKGESLKPGTLLNRKHDPWKDTAKKEIEKIREEAVKTVEDENGKKRPVFSQLTEGDKDRITALERKVSKLAYDCGMRGMYIAKRDSFNGINISGLTGNVKQFNAENFNGLKPTGWSTVFSFPWQDYREIRQNKVRREALEAYKRRSFFFPPFTGKQFVLNTEELATLFHFPGQVSQTPSFTRLVSKKGEPPANLPI